MPKTSLLNQCSDENFIQIVNNSTSVKECEEKLGYNSYSGCVANNISKRIKDLNLDISHFTSQKRIKRTPENIFISNFGIFNKITILSPKIAINMHENMAVSTTSIKLRKTKEIASSSFSGTGIAIS